MTIVIVLTPSVQLLHNCYTYTQSASSSSSGQPAKKECNRFVALSHTRRVENKETDWERESRSLLPPPPLYFLAAVNFHSVLLLFLPHAGRCAPLVCCCCCCCLFGVGWLISVGFSSFFRCLRWGKILLRDYQFTWHSPFVLCVPPQPSFFFHSTPWVSPHHADIIFFSTLLLLRLLGCCFFLFFFRLLSHAGLEFITGREREKEKEIFGF